MNSASFLLDHPTYFSGAYQGFCAFGGPCVHFHQECLQARERGFLGDRHVEMLYATLTAWGMHRMGEGKTKLTAWNVFRESLCASAGILKRFDGLKLLDLSEEEYTDAISKLWTCYRSLKLSQSDATIVVNSKALYHLLPELIPPIDRQYTVRFFQHRPNKWRDRHGKFKPVPLPATVEDQFDLFRDICVRIKRLADRVDRALLERELCECGVTPPKAIDNAIVNYVKIVSKPPATSGAVTAADDRDA